MLIPVFLCILKFGKPSGHVDAFNDPLIDNKDSKSVTVQMYFWKIILQNWRLKANKEVEKGKKRFGDSFNEQQFRETNPNVLRETTKN